MHDQQSTSDVNFKWSSRKNLSLTHSYKTISKFTNKGYDAGTLTVVGNSIPSHFSTLHFHKQNCGNERNIATYILEELLK